MLTEQRGEDPGSIIAAHANSDETMAVYGRSRTDLAMKLLIEALSGAAAEAELAGGDESLSGSDYFHAYDAAKLLVPIDQIAGFMQAKLTELRAICGTEMKAPILATAERLMTRKTISGADLHALWEEVRPDRWPGVAVDSPWRQHVGHA